MFELVGYDENDEIVIAEDVDSLDCDPRDRLEEFLADVPRRVVYAELIEWIDWDRGDGQVLAAELIEWID